MDIKPGYMLGAKPRHQAMGHVLGIIAGGFVCTPIFYFALFRGNIDKFGNPGFTAFRLEDVREGEVLCQ